MSEYPPELLEGIEGERERAATAARFLVLQEAKLGFSDLMNRRIARLELTERRRRGQLVTLSFHRAIAKTRVGLYGDTRGLDLAEIETIAEGRGEYELIYETPLDKPEPSTAK